MNEFIVVKFWLTLTYDSNKTIFQKKANRNYNQIPILPNVYKQKLITILNK